MHLSVLLFVLCVALQLSLPLFYSNRANWMIYVNVSAAFVLSILSLALNIFGIGTLSFVFGAINIVFHVSSLGRIMIMIILALQPFAYCYSIGYLRTIHDKHIKKFLILLNASIAISLIIVLSGNMLTMFIFYEMLTIVTIPLIAHRYTFEMRHVIKYYIIYLVGPSLILWLPAILFIDLKIDQVNLAANSFAPDGFINNHLTDVEVVVTFLMCVIGIAKSTFFPNYLWLPSAMCALHPVSALLHAVAVVNIGIYCTYQVVVEVYGYNVVHDAFINVCNANIPLILSCVGLIYSGYKTILQNNLKQMLAYSTINQLHIMLIGIYILDYSAYAGIIAHCIFHSLIKMMMFFTAGTIYVHYGISHLDQLHNLRKNDKLSLIILCFGMINLTGLPFPIIITSISKNTLSTVSLHNGDMLAYYALICSTIITSIYVAKFIYFVVCYTSYTTQLHRITRNKSKIFLFPQIFLCTVIFLIPIVITIFPYNDKLA
jgi:multicomponent Na+:H+ antiporter subunit D